MAAIGFLSIFLLLLFHPTLTLSNNFLSPIFDEVCKEIACGKGKCVSSQNSTFSYECECDPGWKQYRADNDDYLKFLPCVIPNCTVNRECAAAAPAPVQEKASKTNNTSIFDPCHWIDCGGGSCNKTSAFTYSCICAQGFNNLLNATAFPCYKECSIGMDCSTLGISMSNTSTSSPPPALSNNAGLKLIEDSRWLIILLMSLVALNSLTH